jgi:hypothetical protein
MTPQQVEQAAPSWVTFMRATGWGRNPLDLLKPERLNDLEVFIHHTAGSRGSTDPVEAMKRLESISQGMGYSTVAYDAVLHRNTDTHQVTIMGGREGFRSAATKDRNEKGEALCIMGYFHPGHKLSERPSWSEVEGAAWGIVWMIAHGWVAERNSIMGHRDNPSHVGDTTCPGDWLYTHLAFIRDRVQTIMAEINTPLPSPTYTGEYDMKTVVPRRVIDEREVHELPLKNHEVQVVPKGSSVKVVQVSIAVTGHSHSGYLSDSPGTSCHNFTAHQTSNIVLDMPVRPGGTISFTSSTPTFAIVDVRGEGS